MPLRSGTPSERRNSVRFNKTANTSRSGGCRPRVFQYSIDSAVQVESPSQEEQLLCSFTVEGVAEEFRQRVGFLLQRCRACANVTTSELLDGTFGFTECCGLGFGGADTPCDRVDVRRDGSAIIQKRLQKGRAATSEWIIDDVTWFSESQNALLGKRWWKHSEIGAQRM